MAKKHMESTPEEIKEIKQELNKEGLEGGEEGGAEVRIVNKEEAEQLEKELGEKSIMDFRSYIKKHKEILSMAPEFKKIASDEGLDITDRTKGAGMSLVSQDNPLIEKLYFIDKDLNLAVITIDLGKISELKGLQPPELYTKYDELLDKNGFITRNAATYAPNFMRIIDKLKKEKEGEQEKPDSFDF